MRFYVNEREYQQLKEYAEYFNMSMSEFLRDYINKSLNFKKSS